ncbi:MAG: tetratricopeptide repeat protein [Candidatus Marinimicrobia bacterium]|nr:tetratricopeptide repeat protein [Candidatus Neomarinimicrobiota bacterium]
MNNSNKTIVTIVGIGLLASGCASSQYTYNYPVASLNERGLNLIEAGKCDEAVELLEQALEITDLDGVYNNLGTAYNCQGEYDKAVAMFQEAINQNPIATYFHNLTITYLDRGYDGDIERAEQALDNVKRLDPNFKSLEYAYAKLEYTNGNYTKANGYIKGFLENYPDHKKGRSLEQAIEAELNR